jgi:hypothetical protein
VLYIATVHFGSPDWIDIQTKHLREHISIPYQIWTSLEGIDPAYSVYFDRVIDQGGKHPGKLNNLAIEISQEASASDLLMFLDGDAFPIADPIPLISDALSRAPLLAVRRAENLNDRQPHPCFCVTTIGTWHELHGDWSPGYRWVDSRGKRVTDLGGNLLRELELRKMPWIEVLRSNRTNLDPIFFAVYGDVIYHHGAGFRGSRFSRIHYTFEPKPRSLPRVPILRQLMGRINWARRRAWGYRMHKHHVRQSQIIYEKIRREDSAWLSELI